MTLEEKISPKDLKLLDESVLNEYNGVLSFQDAVALCQYVYATNPIYKNNKKKYKSKSRGWFPYIIEDRHYSTWNKLRNGVSGLLGNGAFLGFSTNEDELTNLLKKQSDQTRKNETSKYSSIELYGLLGGRIESPSNPDELFSVIKGRLKRTRTGFRSMIFYRKSKDGNRIESIVYVTEGSKSFKEPLTGGIRGMVDWFGDWFLSNIAQGTSSLSPQYTLSLQNAKMLDTICSSKNIKLCFTGHSLGGGLAVSNAIATNRPAVVFDMAGLHKSRTNRYGRKGDNYKIENQSRGGKVINFYMEGEFLSTKWYEFVGPDHIDQSVALRNIGNQKYNAFTLHDLIFFCKYFKLETLENEDDVFINGI